MKTNYCWSKTHQAFADAWTKGGLAIYLRMQHTHAQVYLHKNINILFKICSTSNSVSKIAILTSIEINSSYSMLYFRIRTIQTDTGPSCALIPDQSNTRINAWNAWFGLFYKLQHKMVKYWLKTNEVCTPARLQSSSYSTDTAACYR